MRNSVVVCLVAYAAATGRPLGNRLAELVHQDPLNEEKLDKMLSLIDDAEEMNLAHPGNGMTALGADKNIVNKWGQKAADEARHGDNADYDLADYIEGYGAATEL